MSRRRATPTALARSLGELEQIERVGSAGTAGAARAHPRRHRRRPADRRARRSSATCCSTSPARAPQRGAARGAPSAAGCTSPSTASSTTRPARRDRARPSRRSTSCSGSPTSSRSCARTAASSRPPPPGALPQLIELADIRGDLHSHTVASDGRNTIEEMARGGARARLRVPRDHRPLGHATASATTSPPTSCAARSSWSREANARHRPAIELLAGSEVNILPDGSLDYDDELLARARLGDRERAHLLRHVRAGDDRADDRRRSSIRWSTRSDTRPAA